MCYSTTMEDLNARMECYEDLKGGCWSDVELTFRLSAFGVIELVVKDKLAEPLFSIAFALDESRALAKFVSRMAPSEGGE